MGFFSHEISVEPGSSLDKALRALSEGIPNNSGDTPGGEPRPENGSTDATQNIAKKPDTTPNKATGVASKYRNIYDKDAIDKDLNDNKGRQSDIDTSYTNNQEEWNNRYKYWDWNLAQDNPRGNLNGMAYRDTLFRSRLADALNNERHLKPTDIGRRTLNYGATGTGADNAGSERWEPIETQEMRQMRANERLDEKARGYDIDRQKRIEDYPMELREKMDDVNRELAKYAAQTGIDVERDMQRAIQAAEYSNSWETYWSTLQAAFAQEYGLDISERVFAKMATIKSYPLRQLYAAYKKGINAPTDLLMKFYDYAEKVIDRAEADGESIETIAYLTNALNMVMAGVSASGAQSAFYKGYGY